MTLHPQRCEYLGIYGMSVICLDSYCPSRHECDHTVKPSCWGQSERDKLLDVIRPEVLAFAKAMEAVLKKHDYRGGWEDCGMYWLIARVEEELQEAKEKWDGKNFNGDYDSVSNELIDVANFCMMFWGNTQRYYHRELRSTKGGEPNSHSNQQSERDKVLEGRKLYRCNSDTCSDNGGVCILCVPDMDFEAPTSCVNPEAFTNNGDVPDCKWEEPRQQGKDGEQG